MWDFVQPPIRRREHGRAQRENARFLHVRPPRRLLCSKGVAYPGRNHMPDAMSLPKRADIPAEQTWDKSSVYASDAEWEAALREATLAIPSLGRFRGRLGESASITLEALRTRDEWQTLIWRIRWFAAMQVKVDVTDQKAAAQHSQALELIARVEAALAYV